jgi:hypothetical protein
MGPVVGVTRISGSPDVDILVLHESLVCAWSSLWNAKKAMLPPSLNHWKDSLDQ